MLSQLNQHFTSKNVFLFLSNTTYDHNQYSVFQFANRNNDILIMLYESGPTSCPHKQTSRSKTRELQLLLFEFSLRFGSIILKIV